MRDNLEFLPFLLISVLDEYHEYPVVPKQEEEKIGQAAAEKMSESIRSSSQNFIEARIKLLSFLADQFLTTSGVREDIQNEGALAGEDHCRVCFR